MAINAIKDLIFGNSAPVLNWQKLKSRNNNKEHALQAKRNRRLSVARKAKSAVDKNKPS